MAIKSKATKFLIKKWLTNASPSYYYTKRYIRKTEYLSNDNFYAIQLEQLKKALSNAFSNVPYYQRNWRAIGFHPGDFKHLEDMAKLPFVDKCVCRDNGRDLLSKNYNMKLLPKVYTGGTTGAPLLLYRSLSDYGRERAYTEYAYETVGMNHSVKAVYMRGKVADESGRYHKVSDWGNILYLSSHNMRDTQLDDYIERIRAFKPILFYTLPSVATVFAEYMKRKQISHFKTLKWVFCPSENLYDFQRELIEDVFKCKIGMFYGHAEHAVFAIRCDQSNMYHMLPQYGYCELIDEKGLPIKEEGVMGEIVGTSFTNSVSPLIRYRTGDYAAYSNRKCPCGRNYMMLDRLQGREQSLAIDKEHAKVSVGPELLCTIHDKSYQLIKQFRIEQRKAGELEVFINTHEGKSFADASRLFVLFFENIFPGLFDIKVSQLVGACKATDKHLYFVQHLK
jgi:phenylacetate-CoA ligase